jgi:hypothetical protein
LKLVSGYSDRITIVYRMAERVRPEEEKAP